MSLSHWIPHITIKTYKNVNKAACSNMHFSFFFTLDRVRLALSSCFHYLLLKWAKPNSVSHEGETNIDLLVCLS